MDDDPEVHDDLSRCLVARNHWHHEWLKATTREHELAWRLATAKAMSRMVWDEARFPPGARCECTASCERHAGGACLELPVMVSQGPAWGIRYCRACDAARDAGLLSP